MGREGRTPWAVANSPAPDGPRRTERAQGTPRTLSGPTGSGPFHSVRPGKLQTSHIKLRHHAHMQSDPVIEKDPAPRGRRRAHAGPARSAERRRSAGRPQEEGPVFVDSSGRRAKLLRRAGMLLGAVCVGYAGVLGLAFMGGISLPPAQLLPFDGGPAAEAGPGGGMRPGYGVPPSGSAPPSGAPVPPPSGGATPSGQVSASASAPASASASGGAN